MNVVLLEEFAFWSLSLRAGKLKMSRRNVGVFCQFKPFPYVTSIQSVFCDQTKALEILSKRRLQNVALFPFVNALRHTESECLFL